MSELNEYHVRLNPVDISAGMENVDALSLDAQEVLRFAQDTKHRRRLVCWMMWVVSLWLIAVLFIVISNQKMDLQIDNKVLITLLATTTVNILGLSRIVLNGLFGSQRRKRGASSILSHNK